MTNKVPSLKPFTCGIYILAIFLFVGFACNSKSITETTESLSSETVAQEQQPEKDQDNQKEPEANNQAEQVVEVKMPQPKVEFPTLTVDKSRLSKVVILDSMIMDEKRLDVVYREFDEIYRKLEQNSRPYLSGDTETLMKSVLVVYNAFEEFDRKGKPLAEMAIKQFKAKYDSDSDYKIKFRETYYEAKEEVQANIVDKVEYRTTMTDLNRGYSFTPSPDLDYFEELLTKSYKFKENAITSIIDLAKTDMLAADHNKGKALTDMLLGTKNRLKVMLQLDPGNSEIKNIIAQVEEKEKSRKEEIKKALEEYRFPERYSGGNAPSGASKIEKSMKVYLEKSARDNYNIQKIVIASEWIAVHSILGDIIYYQIDFYVAQKYPNSEAGVLDMLYVTGKTSGPDMSAPFGSYSVGGLGQMLEKNL